MKSLKSKVILSAVVLIFALVATIGSTFAWFTVSSTVSASNLTLNITTEQSLLIKVASVDAVMGVSTDSNDPATYVTSLTAADFISSNYMIGGTGSPWTIRPTTIIDDDYTNAYVDTYREITAATGALSTLGQSVNTVGGSAIRFKVWVMAQTNADLKVSAASVTNNSTNTSVKQAVEYSSRLSVVSPYTNSTIPGKGYLFANPDSVSPAITSIDYSFIYPNTDPAHDLSWAVSGNSGNLTALNTNLSALNGTLETALTDGTVIQPLTANVAQLIYITVFIEGWDAQASNYLIGSNMIINFAFTIANLNS